jgi:hypothetical protein
VHVYKGYLQGKLSRKQFPKKSHTTINEILELMNSDVCDPFKIKYLRLVQYFIMFIDDFFQQIFTYLMK